MSGLDLITTLVFVLVVLVSPLRKLALTSFLIYATTYLPFEHVITEPYQFHLIYLFIYATGVILVADYHIRCSYLMFICFQYVCVIDRMLNGWDNSLLIEAYPAIITFINISIMWLLLKGNYNDFSLRRNISSSWISYFSNLQIYKS